MQKVSENSFNNCELAKPKRILVATDLTDVEYLLPYVVAQAKAVAAKVTLVHAIFPLEPVVADPLAVPYVDQANILRDARVMLLGVARQLEAQGVICDTAVREGRAGRVIREELDRTGATRLIVGTHARGKLGQVVLGSIAQELISSAHVPVFVVGPQARGGVEHATPRSILHPLSLMANYQDSLDLALGLAQAHGAALTLLHVLEQDVADEINPGRTNDWAKHALEALAAKGVNLASPIQTMVTTGALVPEILKAAEQINADWIVLGADGEQPLWPFTTSAPYKVLTTARIPVLTLRHKPFHTAPMKLEDVHFTSPL